MTQPGVIPFGSNTDHEFNQALNVLAHSRTLSTTGLTATQAGLLIYNNDRLYVLTSDVVFELHATDSDLLSGQTLAYVLDLANSTGDLPSGRVSGLKATVTAYRLDEFAAATSPISIPDGTASGHAVNKAQLDAVSAVANAATSGIALKRPVRAASTSNLTLSGTQAVDGVALVDGDRVLVRAQTTAATNGLYTVAAGAWVRTADADGAGELVPGTLVAVTEGVVYGDQLMALYSDTAVTIGTTAQVWDELTVSATYLAGNGLSLTGSTFAVVPRVGGGLEVDGTGVAVNGTVARVQVGSVPAGATSPVIAHTLGTKDVGVTIRDVATGTEKWVANRAVDTANIELTFAAAPTAGQYRYIFTAATG